MNEIMTYQQWMTRTYIFGAKRSAELRAVDNALLGYHVNGTSQSLLLLESKFDAFVVKKAQMRGRFVTGYDYDGLTKRDGRKIDGVGPVTELGRQIRLHEHSSAHKFAVSSLL
ncbi:hypothetical protein [Methylosinus sp. LW4]|uniref:hypothetical protein n=1 Tax=Methylosinus sp. LW4 TaxID=136993 RepID=UPI00039D6F95|nr:hypothetical protein [Methylosinus sp. LW4]